MTDPDFLLFIGYLVGFVGCLLAAAFLNRTPRS